MRRRDRPELTGSVIALLVYVSAVTAVLTPIVGSMLRRGDWLPAVVLVFGAAVVPRLAAELVLRNRRRSNEVSAENLRE